MENTTNEEVTAIRAVMGTDDPVWSALNLARPGNVVVNDYLRGHLKERRGDVGQLLVDAQAAYPWQRLEDEVLDWKSSFRDRDRHPWEDALARWEPALSQMGDRTSPEWQWRWWACQMLLVHTDRVKRAVPVDDLEHVLRVSRHLPVMCLLGTYAQIGSFAQGGPTVADITYTGWGIPMLRSAASTLWADARVQRASGNWLRSRGDNAVFGPMGQRAHDGLVRGGRSLVQSARLMGIPVREELRARFGIRPAILTETLVV